MTATAPAFWQRKGWRAIALLPLSALFLLLSSLRRLAYRAGLLASQSAPVPVVVVGNVAVGGSGKTPVVIWLAEQLTRHGMTPGIISRGYGGQGDRYIDLRVEDHKMPVEELGRLLKLHKNFFRSRHLKTPKRETKDEK